MFAISATSAASTVARVLIVYGAMIVMLRLVGRRTLSDVTPLDMLVMLLISETVSPALTHGDDTVSTGLLAAATLIGASVITSKIVFRHRRAEVLLSGATEVLIRDGKVDEQVLRRYRISDEDLRTALHQNGVLQVSAVARAFVESDGEITMIKRKDVEDGAA